MAIFPQSNPLCVFVVFSAYSLALITLCFLVSSLSSKAKTAATLSAIFWYSTFAPYYLTTESYDHMGGWLKILLSFFPNTAVGYSLRRIVSLEETNAGLQWASFFNTSNVYDSTPIAWIVFIMLVDAALFFVIAIYVESIFPGSYGVSKPWYFPLQRKYWMRRQYQQFEANEETMCGAANHRSSDFEREPSNRRAGIEIRGLCKRFPNEKLAVNRVTLNMYDDQITVLLGHNGAGK